MNVLFGECEVDFGDVKGNLGRVEEESRGGKNDVVVKRMGLIRNNGVLLRFVGLSYDGSWMGRVSYG